jgi:outer membrane lipoprotein-sorting protein
MMYRLLFVLIAAACAAHAFPQTAEQIAKKTSFFGSARDISMNMTMELKSKTGSRERGLEVFIKRSEGGMRVLARMVSPAFLSQMKFLTHREADGLTSSWLKTSQGVRKLAASSGSERIFDSEFTVEDFTEIDTAGFDCALLEDVPAELSQCYAVEMSPKVKAGYARKILYIHKDDFDLRGIDFMDERKTAIRQYRLLETGMVEGMPYPARSVMRDLRSGNETVLVVKEIDTGHPIPEKTFNKANL